MRAVAGLVKTVFEFDLVAVCRCATARPPGGQVLPRGKRSPPAAGCCWWQSERQSGYCTISRDANALCCGRARKPDKPFLRAQTHDLEAPKAVGKNVVEVWTKAYEG